MPNDYEDVSDPQVQPDPALALLEAYDTSLPHVYGYLLSRSGDKTIAEDLTGETFLAAVGALRRQDPPPVPSTAWLVGVARHKLADHWRRQERETRGLRRAEAESRTGDSGLATGLGREEVEDPWDACLDAVDARRTLEQLGPHHRAVLVLRYLDGLSVPEVAEHVGRTVHATEALLVRARSAFRKAYEGREAAR